MLPIPFALNSVNHRLPSGPLVISTGTEPAVVTGNSVTVGVGVAVGVGVGERVPTSRTFVVPEIAELPIALIAVPVHPAAPLYESVIEIPGALTVAGESVVAPAAP